MTEDKFKIAFMEFMDKTDWMQEKGAVPAKYLGMHRADVLKAMIDEKDKELKLLRMFIKNVYIVSPGIGTGVCGCGDMIEDHKGFSHNHSPVDEWHTYLESWKYTLGIEKW